MTPLSFASAYRQIAPTEKAYVDGYVSDVERYAMRHNERISLALHRPITQAVYQASRGMLDRPLVRAAIAERINELAAQHELSANRVLKEWTSIAFASVGDFNDIGEDGEPYLNLNKATPEQLAAVHSVEVEETAPGSLMRASKRKVKIRLHDKIAALQFLSKYLGLDLADNAHFRATMGTPAEQAALPAGVSPEAAGEAYAAMINGG